MNTSCQHLAAAVSCLLTITTMPGSARATSNDPVTTQLSNPPIPGDPDGTCSRCQIDEMTVDTSSGDHAVLELYYEDSGSDLDADIYVRVLLNNDDIHEILVEDVPLEHQKTEVQWLSSGSSWGWEDVRHTWVRVYEASAQ